MTGISDIFLSTALLAALDLLPKHISNLVSMPWFDICLEYQVDFFERPSHSLRVHEEHVYSHDAAEDSENNIGLPLNVVERGCHKVSQGKVENPVGSSRNANTLSPVLQRENL